MRILILGRTSALYATLKKLRDEGHTIVAIVTSKASSEYEHKEVDFAEYACKLKIHFHQTASLASIFTKVQSYKADIAISVNFPNLISQKFIDIFPFGILNAHGGDLPRYRGNACQAWALLNGEKRIGLCIHKMIGGELDSGDIIARDYLAIDLNTKITQVWEWMTSRTPDMFIEAIQHLETDPQYILERQSTLPNHILRCYPRQPDDGRINWNKPAIEVLRLINASNKPYSGSFCYFKEEKLIIWDAQLVKDRELFCAVPGQIVKIDDEYIEVACGVEKIRVLLIEYRGQVSPPRILIKSIRERLK